VVIAANAALIDAMLHAAAFGGASGGVFVSEFRRRFTLKSPAVYELSDFYHWWGNFLKKVVIRLSNMFKV